MTDKTQNLLTEIYSGVQKDLLVTCKTASGTPKDLTSATITYKIGDLYAGTTALTKSVGSGITITDATAGEFTISIDAADTASLAGTYTHQLKVTDSSGKSDIILTGTVRINSTLT